MPTLTRSLLRLAVVSAGLLTAAGLYTEYHHAPDQS